MKRISDFYCITNTLVGSAGLSVCLPRVPSSCTWAGARPRPRQAAPARRQSRSPFALAMNSRPGRVGLLVALRHWQPVGTTTRSMNAELPPSKLYGQVVRAYDVRVPSAVGGSARALGSAIGTLPYFLGLFAVPNYVCGRADKAIFLQPLPWASITTGQTSRTTR